MRLIPAPPRKNVWWNQDTNMKTARRPLWNRRRFREGAGAGKNKRAPDVGLVESGHQNPTRCLAQRSCWLEPVVPPPLPPDSLSDSNLHFSSHLPLSSPFSSFVFLLYYSFLLSIVPSFHCPFIFYLERSLIPILSFLLLSLVSNWKTTVERWEVGKAFLSLNSCCELCLSNSPWVSLTFQSSVVDGGLFTLLQKTIHGGQLELPPTSPHCFAPEVKWLRWLLNIPFWNYFRGNHIFPF